MRSNHNHPVLQLTPPSLTTPLVVDSTHTCPQLPSPVEAMRRNEQCCPADGGVYLYGFL